MEIEIGKLIKKAKLIRCGDGEYPVLSMTMHDGLMFQNDRFKKQIASVDQSQYQVVQRHQLVESFPIDEGVLAVQELTDAGIVSPAYKIWDVDMEKVVPKYLEFALRAPRSIEYYKSKLRGTTARRRSIPDTEFCAMRIKCPSLDEQKIIVDTIEKTKRVINSRNLELDTLDDLIKARFVEMFGHQSHNEKSLPYMTIDDVAEIYLGVTHTPTYVDSGVMFISAKNTSGDFLDLSDVKYISREEFEGAPKGSKPQVNDVLFSRVGSNLGHPVILKEELELCTFVSLGFLRSKGIVTSNYLKHWMRDEFFAKQVSEHVKGGGQPNLNTGWLKDFKIIVPDLEKQKEFDDFCNQVDKSKFIDIINQLKKLLFSKRGMYYGN